MRTSLVTDDAPFTMQCPVDLDESKLKHAQITAIALTIVALVLYTSALVLYGLATFPPPTFAGLEFIPMLGGAFISFVALGVLVGSVSYAFLSAYQIQQIRNQHTSIE